MSRPQFPVNAQGQVSMQGPVINGGLIDFPRLPTIPTLQTLQTQRVVVSGIQRKAMGSAMKPCSEFHELLTVTMP